MGRPSRKSRFPLIFCIWARPFAAGVRIQKRLWTKYSNAAVVLDAAGYEVKVNQVNIATRELAVPYRFISSPTIRINGNGIAVELKESLCEDCRILRRYC
ncbi:DUF2703 domain-containing protein [Caproicibacter sp. BJN0012]|uniref:DUF2703 domain-containing protein n=1 Tax=Caproicibacter sp. BJN0012 TaxID=3110227 RepID=UPI003FA4B0FA